MNLLNLRSTLTVLLAIMTVASSADYAANTVNINVAQGGYSVSTTKPYAAAAATPKPSAASATGAPAGSAAPTLPAEPKETLCKDQQTIMVASSAVAANLRAGATLGACAAATPAPSTTKPSTAPPATKAAVTEAPTKAAAAATVAPTPRPTNATKPKPPVVTTKPTSEPRVLVCIPQMQSTILVPTASLVEFLNKGATIGNCSAPTTAPTPAPTTVKLSAPPTFLPPRPQMIEIADDCDVPPPVSDCDTPAPECDDDDSDDDKESEARPKYRRSTRFSNIIPSRASGGGSSRAGRSSQASGSRSGVPGIVSAGTDAPGLTIQNHVMPSPSPPAVPRIPLP